MIRNALAEPRSPKFVSPVLNDMAPASGKQWDLVVFMGFDVVPGCPAAGDQGVAYLEGIGHHLESSCGCSKPVKTWVPSLDFGKGEIRASFTQAIST
jgi:hypothetical protein